MKTSPEDRGPAAPFLGLAIGAMATMVAFVALIVAGLATADLFPATGTALEAAPDRGVAASTQAWANPLALTGLGVIFGVAIPLALHDVQSAIGQRRDDMVSALPTLIKGAQR